MYKAMFIILALIFILGGCSPTAQPSATLTPTLAPTITAAAASATPPPTPSTTPPPTPTAAPSITPVQVDVTAVNVASDTYIDDRSSAVRVLASLFNAVNRREYLRAYSYWESGEQIAGTPFSTFEAGYADTESILLDVGQVYQDAGAGNLYYTVEVSLTARTTGGAVERYTGCYLLHLGQPAIQGTPPFRPLAIRSGVLQSVPAAEDQAAFLGQACATAGIETGQVLPAAPAPAPDDISAERYLDDRSDALQVLRSFFNAINRHEYLRAYSYWDAQAASTALPAYDQFAAGYADTASVALTSGTVQADAGAGQRYYKVPVTLVAAMTGGQERTYVGCYSLHISAPDIQATPPFSPLAIISATVQTVGSGSDPAKVMATICE